jgi:hypothetical protein
MAKMYDTEQLARLPKAEQQRILGGQSQAQGPGGGDQGGRRGPAQQTRSPGQQGQRTLTADEMARRKQTLAGGQGQEEGQGDPLQRQARVVHPADTRPAEQQLADYAPDQAPEHVRQGMRTADGGPHEGYARRLDRVAAAIRPEAVDYDRDGYPDAVVGRSGRNYNEHLRRVNRGPGPGGTAAPQGVDRNRDGFPDAYTLGPDGHRQDQIGYRDRLRTRQLIARELGHLPSGSAATDLPMDPRVLALTRAGVASHGSVGVPGGLAAPSISNPADAPAPSGSAMGYTPVQQAVLAPQTARTGRENKGAQLVAPGGAWQTSNQRSPTLGHAIPQGTYQEDGSFVVSPPQGNTAAGTSNEDEDKAAAEGETEAPDIQESLPEDQPNPASPAPTAGPAQLPRSHASTPQPEESATAPQSVSPPPAPEQQDIPGQQHPTAQQAPAQEPQSRMVPDAPRDPGNAPKPADRPAETPQPQAATPRPHPTQTAQPEAPKPQAPAPRPQPAQAAQPEAKPKAQSAETRPKTSSAQARPANDKTQKS